MLAILVSWDFLVHLTTPPLASMLYVSNPQYRGQMENLFCGLRCLKNLNEAWQLWQNWSYWVSLEDMIGQRHETKARDHYYFQLHFGLGFHVDIEQDPVVALPQSKKIAFSAWRWYHPGPNDILYGLASVIRA